MEIIENIRQIHEQIEQQENEIVSRLKHIPLKYEDKIKNETIIKELQQSINQKSLLLKELYNDQNKSKMNEINEISQNGIIDKQLQLFDYYLFSIENVFETKQTMEINTNESNQIQIQTQNNEIQNNNINDIYIPFSGEESNGKCLDLLQIYHKLINIMANTTYKIDKFESLNEKQIIDWEYTNFISEFFEFTNERYLQLLHINSFEMFCDYIKKNENSLDIKQIN